MSCRNPECGKPLPQSGYMVKYFDDLGGFPVCPYCEWIYHDEWSIIKKRQEVQSSARRVKT